MKPTYYDWGLSPDKPFVIRLQKYHEKYYNDMDYDFHNSIHLNIVLEGDQSGFICGTPFSCRAGEGMLTAPWEPHKIIASTEGALGFMIAISLDELERVLLDGKKNFLAFLSLAPDVRFAMLREKKLMKYCRICGEEILRNGEENTLLCWKSILDCIISLVSELGELDVQEQTQTEFTRLLPALHRINSGRCVTTADEAAKLCNLSVGRFRVLFRQVFRRPFASYELNCRLNCAADDILNSRMTVKDAAYEWGFYDTSHFSRLFKRTFGCPPGQYKRRGEE